MAGIRHRSHTDAAGSADGPEPSKEITWRHRLSYNCRGFVALALLLLGYGIWRGWHRPAYSLRDERQVLILGTMSSGTTWIASELRSLGLQVEHENSARGHPRDGTASWIHALYYMPFDDGAVRRMCEEPGLVPYAGWHVGNFVPVAAATKAFAIKDARDKCPQFIKSQYGCALRDPDVHGNEPTLKPVPHRAHAAKCHIPFRKTLLQVRHPLKTIASLVAGFCPKQHPDGTNHNATPINNPQLLAATALLGSELFNVDWVNLKSCTHAFAWYWLVYNRFLAPMVHDVYRVEDHTPCEIARMAGFFDDDAVDPHSREHVEDACGRSDTGHGSGWRSYVEKATFNINNPANLVQEGQKGSKNIKNTTITYKDLEELDGADGKLVVGIRELARAFGYE